MAKMKEKEAQEGELACGICQVASSTAALLLESCLAKQKAAIFGTNRGFSCDFCDVPRGPNVPPELVCVVCQQGFWPVEKYRKHIGSLYHLKRCAGDTVEKL